jgi:protoheme IX farnesyltransferase
MLGYTIMLLPLTLLPWLSGDLGWVYGVFALVLGGRLLWYCVRLLREPGTTPTAWAMYKYSLAYLFLLFIAMGIDRVVPFGHGRRPPEVVTLGAPTPADTAATETAHAR